MSLADRARRPDAAECGSYYAGYFPLVPDGDLAATLRAQGEEHARLFEGLAEELHDFRYAPGKWSVKELLGHLVDTERVFAYRALRFARGDATPLEGMDQDVFVEGGRFGARALAQLAGEYRAARAATLALLEGHDARALAATGTASGMPFSVRSLYWFVAGHERHHVGVLRERYL